MMMVMMMGAILWIECQFNSNISAFGSGGGSIEIILALFESIWVQNIISNSIENSGEQIVWWHTENWIWYLMQTDFSANSSSWSH